MRLTGPDGQTVLDKAQRIGNWSTAFAEPDSQRFHIQNVAPHPYSTGSYNLTLQLANGSEFSEAVSVDHADPLDRISVSAPTSNEVLTDANPVFRFDAYTSPLYTGVEARSLTVLVENASTFYRCGKITQRIPTRRKLLSPIPWLKGFTSLSILANMW